MEDYKSAKVTGSTESLGLSMLEKFDAKKSPRGVTNEETQRPAAVSETIKTDKGSFKMK